MKKETNIQVSEELCDLIDKYFPKGHKDRGKVLAINAQALCEGYYQGRSELKENEISLCNSCFCMTKTKKGTKYICGKCKKDRRKKQNAF